AALEGHAALQAAIAHHVAVGVADQLQPGGDEAVVDAPLAEPLGLVLVLLRERVLHLFEAIVMHPRRIHMAAGAAGAEGSGELDGDLDGRVGMLGVVEGDVDVPVGGRHHDAREHTCAGPDRLARFGRLARSFRWRAGDIDCENAEPWTERRAAAAAAPSPTRRAPATPPAARWRQAGRRAPVSRPSASAGRPRTRAG